MSSAFYSFNLSNISVTLLNSILLGCGGGLVYQLVCYVFRSLGLYILAKRRGIRCRGLAWVPLAQLWILGSISDQYKYVTARKIQGRRKLLIWMGLILFVINSAAAAALAVRGIDLLIRGVNQGIYFGEIIGLVGTLLLAVLVAAILGVVYAVFYFIALYNLYASSMPGNAAAFLVLSIFFPITIPFFIFACRNKDEGLPPRYGYAAASCGNPAEYGNISGEP